MPDQTCSHRSQGVPDADAPLQVFAAWLSLKLDRAGAPAQLVAAANELQCGIEAWYFGSKTEQ
jgi:hypothetical protein